MPLGSVHGSSGPAAAALLSAAGCVGVAIVVLNGSVNGVINLTAVARNNAYIVTTDH